MRHVGGHELARMNSNDCPIPFAEPPTPRWWLAGLILLVGTVVMVVFQFDAERAFQARNLRSAGAVLATLAALLLWLLLFSRLPWGRRVRILGGVLGVVALGLLVFRFQGFSGDLVPQFTWRWNRSARLPVSLAAPLPPTVTASAAVESSRSFPQFLGPNR